LINPGSEINCGLENGDGSVIMEGSVIQQPKLKLGIAVLSKPVRHILY